MDQKNALRKRAQVLLALLVSCFAGISLAQAQAPDPERFVILGAGRLGNWVTEYSIANGTATSKQLGFDYSRDDQPCVGGGGCETIILIGEVPANGTLTVDNPQFGINPKPGYYEQTLATVFVRGADLGGLSVRSRVRNLLTGQSVDLPVFRLSTLRALNPPLLLFPGATRSSGSRSNLILHTESQSGGCEDQDCHVGFRIEAYSKDGALLAGHDTSLELGRTLFIVDVLGFLGVSSLDGGQVRVTKTDSGGILWGIMPSLNADGSLSVSVGAHP